jgi:hypothetical protein
MAAAAATYGANSGGGGGGGGEMSEVNRWNNDNLRNKFKGGYGTFTNQVHLARNSMSMRPCSSDHINDLLTFAPK